MDAALYFQLVDAITNVRAPRDLAALSERVAATAMHPLERRVLERAIRARFEALDLSDATLLRSQTPPTVARAHRPTWPTK